MKGFQSNQNFGPNFVHRLMRYKIIISGPKTQEYVIIRSQQIRTSHATPKGTPVPH